MFFLNKHFTFQVTRTALVALLVWFSTSNAQVLPFQEAKERADKGDAFAQAVVAMHYQLGWDTEKDLKQAARYAHASAKANHALGLFRVGTMMRNGEGFAKDEKKGLELQGVAYKALKDAKDPYSITATAIMIFQGKVAGQNIDENERRPIAAGLYKQAADMGYAPAQFNYAMALNDGHGVEKDTVLFDKYINAAIESGYPLANNFEIKTKSSHKGANDGIRWAYEFLEISNNDAKRESLHSLASERLLFVNDDWIVAGSLVVTGLGRARTVLSFYDARCLTLKASVSVPNAVTHVDWSQQRNQFLAVTTRGEGNVSFLKWPDDVAQALVLIDIEESQIERLPLWKNSEKNDFNYDPNCAPKWKSDRIEVSYTSNRQHGSPLISAAPHSSSFAGISIDFKDVAGVSRMITRSSICADTSSLDIGGIPHGARELLESKGGYYSGSRDFLISSLSPSVRRVSSGPESGVNLVRPLSTGALSRLNLSTLTSFYNKLGEFQLGEAGIFSDGTLYAVVMNYEGIADADGARSISVSPSEVCYLTPTGHLERVKLDGCKPVFGDTAFYYLNAGDELLIKRTDSLGNSSVIKANVPDISARCDVFGFSSSLDPLRNAIGLVFGPHDDPLDRTFKEFNWESGEVLSGPTNASTGKGYFDRTAGSAP